MKRFLVTHLLDREFRGTTVHAEDEAGAVQAMIAAHPSVAAHDVTYVDESPVQAFTFTLYGNVDNAHDLLRAAKRRAKEDGLDDEATADLVCDGVIDITACLRMILDPGSLDGCSIHDSAAELTIVASDDE